MQNKEKMKIILIRHGETESNAKKISQGWLDLPLSEKGLEQAKKTALILKNENIDYIYSSDLIRALDTAKEILKLQPKSKLILEKSLREQNKGIYEGKPIEESQRIIEKLGVLWHEFKPENGESYQEVLKRVSEFYENLKQKYKDKTIAIVTHGGPLSLLISYLKGEDLREHRKYLHKNAAITIIHHQDNPKIIKLSSVEHLE